MPALKTIAIKMSVHPTGSSHLLGYIVKDGSTYKTLRDDGQEFAMVFGGSYHGTNTKPHSTVKSALSAFDDPQPSLSVDGARPVPKPEPKTADKKAPAKKAPAKK